MPIEPYEITTVYPDGTTETRMSTPEEMAQREADAAAAAAEQAAREAEAAAKQAAKESAIAKLSALGLTAEEAAALLP